MNNSFEKLLADWLSSFDGLPKISPELLPKKNGELSIKIRKGPQTVRRYISGVKIVYAEFALRLRVSHADSKTRLDALKTLENAGITIREGIGSLSVIKGLCAEIKEYPKLCQRTDNGDDEYEALYYIVFSEDE